MIAVAGLGLSTAGSVVSAVVFFIFLLSSSSSPRPSSSMGALTLGSLKTAGLKEERLLLEPMAKNTGAAIALTCWKMEKLGLGNEIAGVFPADHLVEDQKSFFAAVKLAEQVAQQGQLVTLGIRPKYAATGYGYIESTENVIQSSEEGLKAFK